MSGLRQRARGKVRRLGLDWLHGVPVETTGVERSSEIPLSAILPLIYPDVPADRVERLGVAAESALGGDKVRTTADLRRVLGALDRQAYPSPASLRFRAEDVFTATVLDNRMVLDRADFAVSAFVTDGSYEPHVSAVISTYCQPGMSVIDIGANIGIHTVAFSRLVGDSGRVLAIEPSSENCRLILASASENGCDNVELVPLALDTKRGWAYFSHHVGSNGGLVPTSAPEYVEGGGWIVPTAALDDVISDRVDFIKVDVEGAEGRAIGGALKTLERWRPIVISELSCEMLRRVSGMEPEAYLSLFAHLGYRLHVIDRDEPGRLVALSPSELLSTWDDELRIEDLLFLPS